MVQGQTKGLAKGKNASARHAQKAAAAPKKGKRSIAPKKAVAAKQAAMHKVSSTARNAPSHRTFDATTHCPVVVAGMRDLSSSFCRSAPRRCVRGRRRVEEDASRDKDDADVWMCGLDMDTGGTKPGLGTRAKGEKRDEG